MEIIQQEQASRTSVSLADRVNKLEKKAEFLRREKETLETKKQFKWPWKWKRKFAQSNKKKFNDMMLVVFLNKKNVMEAPKFMPIFDGNMIVYKNKPYEFDPRAVWRVQGMKGNPQAYLIKEIDRRPVRNKSGTIVFKDAAVSNQDLDEIRARGDSTESDEFLIKAALKAQTSQVKKQMNVAVMVIIGIIIVGGLIWFLTKG